ncbi:hypothetical protein AB3X96_18045 [Paraburkholderia sp. BR13439]|uniref:hypothetical protein n=1 Tax=Paraburkholderia sp. BR13439 TaxID=3236996 RepID=UPI0034CD19A6
MNAFNVFSGMVAALTEGGDARKLSQVRDDRFVGTASNASAVAETWTDPDVRKERMTRDRVQVTLPSGEVRTYRSVRDAFRGLHLPDSKHIRFRLKLKQERVRNWTRDDGRLYRFEIVPLLA